ncbi:hypothetical protein F4694_005389 [Bacillus niacini]|uniref:Uncharacterized protein n=1 Tax=Neobacillus niacini TaxID=86668 RepID=A0A852TK40_9BACI|nr:hypothetical protein [Neobacillus niacini]
MGTVLAVFFVNPGHKDRPMASSHLIFGIFTLGKYQLYNLLLYYSCVSCIKVKYD